MYWDAVLDMRRADADRKLRLDRPASGRIQQRPQVAAMNDSPTIGMLGPGRRLHHGALLVGVDEAEAEQLPERPWAEALVVSPFPAFHSHLTPPG